MYVPVEYSKVIPGQRKNRLEDRQQAMMIKKAAIPPGVSCLRCLAMLVPCQQHVAGPDCFQVLNSAFRCSTVGLRHHACEALMELAVSRLRLWRA